MKPLLRGLESKHWIFYSAREVMQFKPPHDVPVVVLLDLKLPKETVLKYWKKVEANERTRRLPVVIMTSSTEEQDIVNSYDLGANSYIRKPVDFNQFTDVVAQLGLYWLDLNEVPDTWCDRPPRQSSFVADIG